MEMITGATTKSLVIKVHFRIGMTIHTGVMKADIIGAFITIHILGIAMHIDTWKRTGRGTELTTGESQMYIMTIGTMTNFNIELETILVEGDIVTVIIIGIVFVSVREGIMTKDTVIGSNISTDMIIETR